MMDVNASFFPSGREPKAADFVRHFQDIKEQSREALLTEVNSGERPVLDDSLQRRSHTSPLLPQCLNEKVISSMDPEDMTPAMRHLELGLVLAAAQEFPGVYGTTPLLSRACEFVDRLIAPAHIFGEQQVQGLLDEARKNWSDEALTKELGTHRVSSMHTAERKSELSNLLKLYVARVDLQGSIRLGARIRNLIGDNVPNSQLRDERWHSALIERVGETS